MFIPPLLALLALFSTLLSATPLDTTLVARGGSITFEQCSATQKTLINSYLRDMVKLAKAGADATEVAAGHESAVYKAWWGAQPDDGLINERVNSRFEKLAAFITNPRKNVIFNCGKNTGCTGTRCVAKLDFAVTCRACFEHQNLAYMGTERFRNSLTFCFRSLLALPAQT